VSFKTQLTGNFVGAQNDGGGAVIATATVAQAWETFSLIDSNGGTLQSGDSVFVRAGNGQYFQALNGGGSTLNAGSNNQLGWETFKIVKQSGSGTINSGDVVGLQASTGSWVSAANGGGGTVFAYGGALGSWESLIISIGGSASGGGGNPPNVPGQPTLPNGRGATLNFVEYEAENMSTNGAVLAPTRTFGQSAAEASGRSAVRLSSTGQYVQFSNATDTNSIVVRYSIPDGGADYWATLGVYVNGALRTRLSLTSRYSWTYGGDNDFNQPDQNDPSLGNAHHFYDEARALIGDVPLGATVMLRKDGSDTAGYYDIDLVDMEQVPGPIGQPAGYLSLTSDCGATPNDSSDDSNAIQSCVDLARGQGRGLYIPQGTFNSFSKAISVAGVTIRGAGMWYSTIYGYNAHFDCWGNNCQYYDFAVTGDSTQRIDTATDTAFGGNGSSGVVLDSIWIEHTKTGYWTGASTNGLVIRNSRIRDLFADGVNLYGGSSNCTLQNIHARNTGDDAFAGWSDSANGQGPDSSDVIQNNYVQLPWRANCFALYGGQNNQISDNVCADVVQYPGILLARQFNSLPFSGTTTIARNTLIRAGAWAYNQEQGALKIQADQASISGISVTDLDVQSPTYFAVHVQGTNAINGVTLSNVTVSSPGEGVFFLNSGANGSMSADHVVASGSPNGVRDDTGGAFNLIRGAGNSGW
ncbi:MAG TPA: glycosyl hydrolase family 28-related protein, partial [Polyangiaceae bacterium]|nr:glycosyl hydrolase family 28-related protein [Polyangiaceae bacterium]